ncbi:MAG: alanine racemase [Eggerthellaceae bacterium]|nr:alanine racemase [Eggerthellaceae bacterium]
MDEMLALAKRFGTPLYVFDGRVLQKRIETLRAALPANVELCYAVKANTFIIDLLAGEVARFEACSEGEARICLKKDPRPGTLVVSGVNKDAAYMEELIAANTPVGRYTIESRLQFDMLLDLAKKYDTRIPLLLRLTSGNQFGLDKSEVISIIAEFADDPHLDIWGIQYFSGTQKTSIKRLARELRQVRKMIDRLKEDYGFSCREVEFGPGFPVPYFDDEEFDEPAFFAEFSALLDQFAFEGPISLELGRSIAASCGTFLTSVVDVKRNDGQNYVIVDGGMNHLVYYGQSLAMRQPTCALLREKGTEVGEPEPFNICGSLCSVNDILAKQLELPGMFSGDILRFDNTGAYCMTEGISLFLSRDLPRVCLIDANGEARLVRDFEPTWQLNESR